MTLLGSLSLKIVFCSVAVYAMTQLPVVGPKVSMALDGKDLVAKADRNLKSGYADDGKKITLAGKSAIVYFYAGVATGQFLANQIK